MPYVLKPNEFFARDPNNNRGYLPQNVIATQTADEQVALVEAAGAETIANVQQAVSDSQAAVASIDNQRDTMIAAIARIAGQGTDPTLTQTNVAADAKATGDAVSDLKSAIGVYEATGWVNGYRVNTSGETIAEPSSSATYAYLLVENCLEGDVFTLTGKSTTTTFRLWCWCKTDGTIVSKAGSDADYTKEEIICPKGATKLYVNAVKAYTHRLFKGRFLPNFIDEAETKFPNFLYLKWHDKSTIPSGTDIDNYNTLSYVGQYGVTTAVNAAAISHLPIRKAGVLAVITTSQSDRLMQVYVSSSSEEIYWRKYYDGEWEQWKKVATDKDIEELHGDFFYNAKNIFTKATKADKLRDIGINSTTGAAMGDAQSGISCRTYYLSMSEDVMITLDSEDYIFSCWSYNNAKNPTHSNSGNAYIDGTNQIYVLQTAEDRYIRLGFYRADRETMTTDLTDPDSDYSIILSKLTIYSKESGSKSVLLAKNPYKHIAKKKDSLTGDITWSDAIQDIKSVSHCHITKHVHLKRAIEEGYEHLAISNYHASKPMIPVMDYIQNMSDYDSAWVMPSGILESPNAEHVYFKGAVNSHVHMNSIGSYATSGTDGTGVGEGGFEGTEEEFGEQVTAMLEHPNSGGISINHAQWSGLTSANIVNMMQRIPSVFAMEIYGGEGGQLSTSQWDGVLSQGIQIFGLAVPDHALENLFYNTYTGPHHLGFNHMLCMTRTEKEVLLAYRNGRFYTTAYNDDLLLKYFDVVDYVATIRVSKTGDIKFITAARSVTTENTNTATLSLTPETDVYVRVEVTSGNNTLFTNAIML